MWTILCRVVYEGVRVLKCISLATLSKFMHGVPSWGPSNQLSSRTSGTSGYKHCRVDNENCRVEKCISLGTLRKNPARCCHTKLINRAFVLYSRKGPAKLQSEDPINALSFDVWQSVLRRSSFCS